MTENKNEWQTVLRFWFEEVDRKAWFAKDPVFDENLKMRFGNTLKRACRCELVSWRETIQGRLAEIIVLDQFSRNIFRGTAQAFSQDSMALALAQEALRDPEHQSLPPSQKAFLFMPFMHSESVWIHEWALRLFSEPGLESNLEFENLHKKIIDRFGRYPHRNSILGRVSTPEEIEFLKEERSSF